ncbi:MAG: uroporphyrinogen decarboxylase family protein [Anaerolineae bacterium]
MLARENLLRAITHEAPDHVPWEGEAALVLVDHAGRRPPIAGVDAWGVTWAPLPESYRPAAGEPAASYPVAHPARTAAELLALPLPPVSPTLFASLFDGERPTDALIVGRHEAGPFERFAQLLGMMNALNALLREPEASAAALLRIAEYHAQVAARYLAAGVEAGWLADDYAGDAGPFFRPELWRRLILPAVRHVVAVYRQAGALVFFHTCGRAEAFIPDLLEAGVTVFNLQSDVCDLAGLKARFGRRIAFYGGVPAGLMLRGTPQQVQERARIAMQTLGREGGLILAADQPLAYPRENVAALEEAARKWGRYPLI